MSSQFDRAMPYRLWAVPSIGVGPGNRAGLLQVSSFATLAEARSAARASPPTGDTLHITEGEDPTKIVWRMSDPE